MHHLWADTFDRKTDGCFYQIESDIAKTIAEKLQAKLTGSEERAHLHPSRQQIRKPINSISRVAIFGTDAPGRTSRKP